MLPQSIGLRSQASKLIRQLPPRFLASGLTHTTWSGSRPLHSIYDTAPELEERTRELANYAKELAPRERFETPTLRFEES